MKYDNQLTEVKNALPNAKNILITLPTGSDIDKLASALSLYLVLKNQGKEVAVACEDTIKVAQAHLFAIDQVKNTIPQLNSGNYSITLEGVAIPDASSPTGGRVPSLEKLDYYVSGNNLNLVFNILPGQAFQPTNVIPGFQGGFDLIITIGTASLSNLGSIYTGNQTKFTGTHIVNIDNNSANTNFGKTNVIDPAASSISEMVVDVILSLGLVLDADTASNLLTGIFDATSNMTNQKVIADTYLAVATALRVGGKKPGFVTEQANTSIPMNTTQPTPGFDLSMFMPKESISTSNDTFTVPPVVPTAPAASKVSAGKPERPSPEERPMGEGVVSEAEPDWLTPKVFKGTSVG